MSSIMKLRRSDDKVSKFCSKCGNEVLDSVAFCNKCGNPINGNGGNTTVINNIYNGSNVVTNRSIPLAIILSIITCGIYGLYWICVMNDDANRVSGEVNDTSGALVIVFSLLTCGIYSIYWNYKMGKKLYTAGQNNGKQISDNSLIYLILSLLGLSIVNYCLIQNDLNSFSS